MSEYLPQKDGYRVAVVGATGAVGQTMRAMGTASCNGFNATTNWMVEQLGLAMMRMCLAAASACGFTSGTMSGTSGRMRQALELSTT